MFDRPIRNDPIAWMSALLVPAFAGRLLWATSPDDLAVAGASAYVGFVFVGALHAALTTVLLLGVREGHRLLRSGDGSDEAVLARRRRSAGVAEALVALGTVVVVALGVLIAVATA